ncbi:MAG: sigma-70 family RNA polymerase sigma factor [Bacteroidetes bacterium]|nr:sigma-70 family RNA polymerase sigma factor [Bacteroidota bacterium]
MVSAGTAEDIDVLIRKCASGDEKAIKTVYKNYYGKMLNVCLKYAANREEAKDALQEGFISAFKNIGRFEFQGSFEGWLRRIMINTSINMLKKRMRGPEYFNRDLLTVTMQKDPSQIDDSIIAKINAEEILSYIQNLPPVYRIVFNLSAIEGYSHKEIAEMLNITESTSRANLAKARQKLQSIILLSSSIINT